MVNITSIGSQFLTVESKVSAGLKVDVSKSPGDTTSLVGHSANVGAVSDGASISTLALRLSRASTSIMDSTNGLDYKALNAKAGKNLQTIL